MCTFASFPIDSISPTSSSFSIHTTTPSTSPLTLPAPLHSPVTQLPSYPLTPSAPALLSTVVQVESNKIPYKFVQTSTSSKPYTSRNMPLASTQENISNKPPCKFYMQGKCKNGKEAHIALSHIQICVFVSYAKVKRVVIKVYHANMHTQRCVGHR